MKTNVAVFFGGRSVEHEISVISASQAMHAINRDKYNVIPVYISKQGKWYTGDALLEVANYRDMNALTAKCEEVFMRPEFGDQNLYRAKKKLFGNAIYSPIDVVIPVLHGTNGEDGIFEGLLETIGIPFAGCNTFSSANGMDKISMKMILKDCGIPVVDYVWFTDKQWYRQKESLIEAIETKIGYPVIVKPANLGSSVGISRAADRRQLEESVENAEKYSTRIIVEDMVENLKEINCSVLGDCDDLQTSILEEPIKTGDFLSYEDKYMGGSKSAKGMQASQKRIPADLTDEMTKRIQHLAAETFRVSFLPRCKPRRRNGRCKNGHDLCQRNQHDSRLAFFLSLGSFRYQIRPTDGPTGPTGPETETRAKPENNQFRPKHLQPQRRR